MDNLTHSLVGLCLSRAGLNRLSPYATPILILAANAPDCDAISALGGPLTYLKYHRHITHSLVAVPFVALLPVLLVGLFARKPFDWKRAWVLSFAGAATHPLLDLTNVYGVRLLLPFSASWFRLDITNVVDLWIWTVLFLAVLAPALARLVSGEIGARSGSGRAVAIFALSFLLLYNAGRAALHARAVATLDSYLYRGAPAWQVAAFPSFGNPFRWRGLVEGTNFYGLHDVNLLGPFDPTNGQVLYQQEPGPAIASARETATFRDYLEFSQYPLWLAVPAAEPENATQVTAIDLRFGTPAAPRFVATAILDSQWKPLRTWFAFGQAAPR